MCADLKKSAVPSFSPAQIYHPVVVAWGGTARRTPCQLAGQVAGHLDPVHDIDRTGEAVQWRRFFSVSPMYGERAAASPARFGARVGVR